MVENLHLFQIDRFHPCIKGSPHPHSRGTLYFLTLPALSEPTYTVHWANMASNNGHISNYKVNKTQPPYRALLHKRCCILSIAVVCFFLNSHMSGILDSHLNSQWLLRRGELGLPRSFMHGSATYAQGSAPNIAGSLLRSTKGAAGTNNLLIIS